MPRSERTSLTMLAPESEYPSPPISSTHSWLQGAPPNIVSTDMPFSLKMRTSCLAVVEKISEIVSPLLDGGTGYSSSSR